MRMRKKEDTVSRGFCFAGGKFFLFAVSCVLLLSACRPVLPFDRDDFFPGQPDPTGEEENGGEQEAADETELVLQLEVGGGFVPRDYIFTSIPELSVYADANVISDGPVIQTYPGPLLPNLQSRRLSDKGLARLRDAVEEAGLLSTPPDYAYPRNLPMVADAPTTILTIVEETPTGRKVYRHSAYALGIQPGGSEDRAHLGEFVERLRNIEDLVGTDEITDEGSYESSAYRLRAVEVDADSLPGDAPEVHEWTLDQVVLSEVGRCTVVQGATARAVEKLFSKANSYTFFRQGEKVYRVLVRPLLPHEVSCTE